MLIAKAVGDTGRVFSNEVNPERVQQISRTVERGGLKNVTVVTGQAKDTNLAGQCCEAVFMRDVYHHFADPEAMNASIMKALKPGGMLAVLDFGPPPGAESPRPEDRDEDGHHGITPETLERELKAAGFEIVATERYGFRSSFTLARRPMPPCPEDVVEDRPLPSQQQPTLEIPRAVARHGQVSRSRVLEPHVQSPARQGRHFLDPRRVDQRAAMDAHEPAGIEHLFQLDDRVVHRIRLPLLHRVGQLVPSEEMGDAGEVEEPQPIARS